MTGYERIKNVLAHKPVDRIPVFEHFWGDTHREYEQQGHVQPGESFEDHFNLDMQECWAFNLMADLAANANLNNVKIALADGCRKVF